jgi:hypothetical protein
VFVEGLEVEVLHSENKKLSAPVHNKRKGIVNVA